jgi:acyl-CoA thioester hydrolase
MHSDLAGASEAVIRWDVANPFVLAQAPQPEDIDGLNHVNNAVYVRWCEQTAWSHCAQLGLVPDDYRRLDRGMAIRRAEYDYQLPVLLGDELALATWLSSSDGKMGIVRNFQLIRVRDRQTVMRARWELVCIELSTGRPRRMPEQFSGMYRAALAGAVAG